MDPSPASPSGAALPLPLSLAPAPLPLPAAAVVHVSFPEVTSALLESLNQQRLQGQLCDVSIRVQGREFRAHRAVLAASSPYFHDQVLLKGMTSISLPSVMDPGAFETVLASAYTGRLSMAAADIVNFLTVGSVLQMWHIVDKCTELLREGRAAAAAVPGAPAAPAPVGSVRPRASSHASSRASENQSPSSSNYFSPRESAEFSSSSQEACAASAVASGDRRGAGGGGPVFPVPVLGGGSATSGKLLLEADELCDDGGDGRGAVVPRARLRRPACAPHERWVQVKRARSCPAPAPLAPRDPDLEDEDEDEDLVLTCEDDDEEDLGGGSAARSGAAAETTLSISDVRTLSEAPDTGEEQVNFCESSNDLGPYESGGPAAGLEDPGGPTPSSYAPSHPPRALLPLDAQGHQTLAFPSSSSSASQAPGQPPGKPAAHGPVALGGTSAGGLAVAGGAAAAPAGPGSGDGNKIFLCHCGKAFSHKSMRDRHVNMHLNLRPFDCPVCGKKFKMKHHLTEHMKTHTGLKPYECGVCAKKFMWRDSFMRHRGHCLATAVSGGPAAIECWFVEDAGRGGLAKRPATLLLRQGPGGPPPRPPRDPELYLKVDDPAGALQAAFRRLPRGAPAPRCELSRFVPQPASAEWARGLIPERSCPRALDGAWLVVSVSSSVLGLSSLLRPQPEPRPEPVPVTMATAVLTVLTHNPAPRIRLGKDAILDLSFAYVPPTAEAATSLAPGPPPFGLEWRRQHMGKGRLLLAATPGLDGRVPPAQEGAVAFAAWEDDDPWGPWTGNGTLWLPAVQPFQEGTYLATIHLPYLQGQVALDLLMHKPPKVSLTPAPLVWATPGETPPELVCLVSHFYPSAGLEVEWEIRGGPEGGFRKAGGQRWFSALRHHPDGSVSISAHLRLPPVTTKQHGARYACRVRHPSLPDSGRSAEVSLEVAGLSGPSIEDGIGLFLSAFLLLGLIKTTGWVAAYLTTGKDSKEKKTQ